MCPGVYACEVPWELEGELEIENRCEPPRGCWGLNLGLLREAST